MTKQRRPTSEYDQERLRIKNEEVKYQGKRSIHVRLLPYLVLHMWKILYLKYVKYTIEQVM